MSYETRWRLRPSFVIEAVWSFLMGIAASFDQIQVYYSKYYVMTKYRDKEKYVCID